MEKSVKIIIGIILGVFLLTIVIWLFNIEIPVYVLSFIGMLVLLGSFMGVAVLIKKKIQQHEKKKLDVNDRMLEICKLVKEKWYKSNGEKLVEEGTMYVTHFFRQPHYGFVFTIMSGDRIGKKIVVVTDEKGQFKKITLDPDDADTKDPFHKFRTFCLGSPTPDVDLRMEPRARWDLPTSRGIEEEEKKKSRLDEIQRRTEGDIREILGDLSGE